MPAELQGALQSAMSTGGPAAAIGVCRDSAPAIAARLSRVSGASVSRISAKFRNPQNNPEPWQQTVLHQFESTLAADPDAQIGLLDHFEQDQQGGARYLKAIAIAPLCLTCHGERLAEPVAAQLDEDYPHDRATGYQAR